MQLKQYNIKTKIIYSDYNQYLTSLLLRASMLHNKFQNDIKYIVNNINDMVLDFVFFSFYFFFFFFNA